jgi:hypothetical protein
LQNAPEAEESDIVYQHMISALSSHLRLFPAESKSGHEYVHKERVDGKGEGIAASGATSAASAMARRANGLPRMSESKKGVASAASLPLGRRGL